MAVHDGWQGRYYEEFVAGDVYRQCHRHQPARDRVVSRTEEPATEHRIDGHTVYSNLRGDAPEKIGIRYEGLKHLSPRPLATRKGRVGW